MSGISREREPIYVSNTSKSIKRRYSLNPLPEKQKNEQKRFAVVDIESANWKDFLVLGYYDGESFETFENPENFIKYLKNGENIPREIYAHFGGIFDFLFILQFALDTKELISIHDCIPRGSGFLCFSLSFIGKDGIPTKTFVFRDSSALLPFSLKKLTETFAPEFLKKELDVTNLKKVTPELIEYLEYDCKGLWHGITNFAESELIKKYGLKTTMASQALQIFRGFIEEPIPSLPKGIDDFVRKSYAGGRTEIFKPLFKGPGKLSVFDVNSLYPHVMRDNDFPTKYLRRTKSYNSKTQKFAFVSCRVEVPKNSPFPILWTRMEKTDKFIFPVGRFSGTWPSCELEYAKKHGAKILEVFEVAEFCNGGKIFKDYISKLYKIRLDSKSEVEKTIAKLAMNSLYGRMGLNTEREGIKLDDGSFGVTPFCKIESKNGPVGFVKFETELETFTNPAISSWVTALARIHMHKLASPKFDSLYYMDTDSLFTSSDYSSSKNLGDLKFEYSTSRACFVLPKTYITDSKTVMKGFENKNLGHLSFDDFANCLDGELRLSQTKKESLARMKSAMRKGSFLVVNAKSTRQLRSKYDKRTLFQVGTTWDSSPLILDET